MSLWWNALIACGREEPVPDAVLRRPECPHVFCEERLTAEGSALAACYGWTEDEGWPEGTPPEVTGCSGAGPCVLPGWQGDWQSIWWFCDCQSGEEGDLVPEDDCCLSPSYAAMQTDSEGRFLQARLQEDCGLAVPVHLVCEEPPAEVPLGEVCE